MTNVKYHFMGCEDCKTDFSNIEIVFMDYFVTVHD